jgi:PRTRC genetic system ThiF family protein
MAEKSVRFGGGGGAMNFPTDTPVKIVLLGAGGTGGYIAPHLYRIAGTLGRKIRAVIADGDVVEQKNLKRQNFAECDIGENKAKVLAERYSAAFGLETEYFPNFVENEETLSRLLETDGCAAPPILIGAVDNNRSRRLCDKVFRKARDLVYVDSGNGEYSGQVVCGVRRNSRTLAKPLGDWYPDVFAQTDSFPSELSCAERSVSAPQSIAANLLASTAVVTLLYHLLALGRLDARHTAFSAKTLNMKTILRKSA